MVCIDYKSLEVLEEEAMEAYEMGYTGKQVIHPSQISAVNRIFSPTAEQIDRARKILEEYERHSANGLGAFELDGAVIDLPVVKQAHNILKRAR